MKLLTRITILLILAASHAEAETLNEYVDRVIRPVVYDVIVVPAQPHTQVGNLAYYDVTVQTTSATANVTTVQTQTVVYNGALDSWSLHNRQVTDHVAPTQTPSAKYLLYAGRQTLIDLRDNAIPIPAAPTAELPLIVSEPAWHGRIISAYTVRKDQTTVAGVPGSIVRIKLRVDGGIDDAVSVFIWVSNAGQYVVDPYED